MTEVSSPPEYASTIFMIGFAVLVIIRSAQSKNQVFAAKVTLCNCVFPRREDHHSCRMSTTSPRFRHGKTRGFTLVEIMVVVVIIGLLAALAIPAIRRSQRSSQNTRVINDFRVFTQAFEIFNTNNGDWPVTAAPGVMP